MSIATVDLQDYLSGDSNNAVQAIGSALVDKGFFAVTNHGIPKELLANAYECAKLFFAQPTEVKETYKPDDANGQRGFTSFGTEHAKDNEAPDLKEFYQIGRTNVPDDHKVHSVFGPNIWPDEHVPLFRPVFNELWNALDELGQAMLEACALYIDEPKDLFKNMTSESDSILRVIHYPPLPADVPPGSVRAAAHEDINMITLLPGATAEGLEILDREGNWLGVQSEADEIIVDTGDMIQNITNGLYKSTTHRVVNPKDPTQRRFSIPCFIHPRREVDLTPLPSCIEKTGGESKYPSITSGAYLDQRLAEIGLKK